MEFHAVETESDKLRTYCMAVEADRKVVGDGCAAAGCCRGRPTGGTAREVSHAIFGAGGPCGKSSMRSACVVKGAAGQRLRNCLDKSIERWGGKTGSGRPPVSLGKGRGEWE